MERMISSFMSLFFILWIFVVLDLVLKVYGHAEGDVLCLLGASIYYFRFIFSFLFFFSFLNCWLSDLVFLAHMFEWEIKLGKELVIGFYVGDWGVASIWNIISPQFSAFACNIFVNIILSKKVKILWAIYGESNGARWPNLVFYQNPSVWWGSGELTVRSNTVIVEGQSL